MPLFHYRALDAQRQLVTGQVEAGSVSAVLAELEAKGLSVQSITQSDEVEVFDGSFPFATFIDDAAPDEQAVLRNHVARILPAAAAMIPSLQAMAQELDSAADRRRLYAVIAVLQRGDVSQAVTNLNHSPEYWIPL